MSITSEIERIKNAKTALKSSIENKGVSVGNGLINTYASKVDEIEGSDSHNAFEVSSIEEMNNLTNVKDGDFCTIYGETLVGITEATSSNVEKLTIYNEFSLNEKLTGLKTLDLLATGAGDRFVCGIYPVGMTVQYNIGEGQRQLEYTSKDGINFSTTGFSGALELSFSNPISSSSCDAIFSQVVKIPKDSFGGVYQASVVDNNVTWNQIIAGGNDNYNSYNVATIQERDALADVKNGDICVVQESIIENLTEEVATTKVDNIIIKDTIVLPEAIQDSNSFYFKEVRQISYSESANLSVEIDDTSARIQYDYYNEGGGSFTYNWQYASQDGITYILDDYSTPTGRYKIRPMYLEQEDWKDCLGYLIQMGTFNFNGVYQAIVENDTITWVQIVAGDTISYFGTPSAEALESEANNYALWVKKFPAIDLSSLHIEPGEPLVLTNFFNYARGLIEVELFDTSEVTNMENMFSYCTSLTTVPVFDMSVVEAVYNMFLECPNLSDESLNNILRMCIDVGNNGVFTGEKVLATLGLSQEQIEACRNLHNYQEFIESGWEEGDNSPVS